MLHLEEQAAAEPRRIAAGDMVIVYERYDSMKSVTVTHKGQYNNRWGSFKMKVLLPPRRRRPARRRLQLTLVDSEW